MARKWFPFIGDAVPLHLVLEHARLPAAADEHRAQGRHLRRRRSRRSRSTRRPPTSRSRSSLTLDRVVQLPRRGHPGQGPRRLPQGLDPAGRRGRGRDPDLRDRGDLALRADRLALRPTVREHPRRPPADPVHGRRTRRAAQPRDRRLGVLGSSPARWRSPSSSSRSAWSPPCRRSSSPPSQPSTSAAPSPRTTKEHQHVDLHLISEIAQAARPRTSPRSTGARPARRSRSASAPASAPSARASASATSSARSSSR